MLAPSHWGTVFLCAHPEGPPSTTGLHGAPCVTFRRGAVSLRGPGQSPVLPFACCVGSLCFVGRRGLCPRWRRFRVRRAQWLVCRGCVRCGGCHLCLAPAPPPPRCGRWTGVDDGGRRAEARGGTYQATAVLIVPPGGGGPHQLHSAAGVDADLPPGPAAVRREDGVPVPLRVQGVGLVHHLQEPRLAGLWVQMAGRKWLDLRCCGVCAVEGGTWG